MKIIPNYLRALHKIKFEAIRRLHLLYYHLIKIRISRNRAPVSYQCNICGKPVSALLSEICDRDMTSCHKCGASLRYRSIIHILSKELFQDSKILTDFNENKLLNGLGLSDWEGYAELLKKKFSYTNTYFHQEPFLDITVIPDSMIGAYDFLICSDVMEHIPPPVSIGFTNLYKLLKKGGLCVLTVPYMNYEKTWENFPELYGYKIKHKGGRKYLENFTKSGEKEIFKEINFHGGAGETLEMRIFSRSSLYDEMVMAGFKEIKFHRLHKPEFGIIWPINWSLIITARKT